MKGSYLAIVALAAAGMVAAQSSVPVQPANQVKGQGCVAAGVEGGCLMVRDLHSGKLYNLLIKGERPQPGIGIEFTGVPFRGITACMQGAPLSVSHWEREERLKCPAGQAPKS